MNKPPRPLPVAQQLPEDEIQIVAGEPVEQPAASKKSWIWIVPVILVGVIAMFAVAGGGVAMLVLQSDGDGVDPAPSPINQETMLVSEIRREITDLENKDSNSRREEEKLTQQLQDAENEVLAVEAKNQSLQNELDSFIK